MLSRFTLVPVLVLGVGLLGACSSNHSPEPLPPTPDNSQIFDLLSRSHQQGLEQVSQNVSFHDLNKALRSVSLIVLGREPLQQELLLSTQGFPEYKSRVQNYLNSSDALPQLRSYFNTVFEMSGTAGGINYEEPANLALYLIQQNKDFREVLTATYCVDDNLNSIQCSSFSDAAQAEEQGAGVLTTRAFLQKWSSAFYFRRTAKAFSVFACSEYPDATDPGLPPEKVSDRVHTFNCQNCNPACYSCHKSMNSRAALFYDFTPSGMFDPNPRGNDRPRTDTGAVSTRRDLLNDGVQPEYHGETMNKLRDYAVHLSKSRKFRDCLAQRLTNFMMGSDPNTGFLHEYEDIRNQLSWNGYQVKPTLLAIATHPYFIQRMGTP